MKGQRNSKKKSRNGKNKKKAEKKNNNNGNDDCNGNGNGKKITKHHKLPRARGGKETLQNVVRIPERYHKAWHTFFGNLTPKEAIAYIRKVFMGRGAKKDKWTTGDLYELQLEFQMQSPHKPKEE